MSISLFSPKPLLLGVYYEPQDNEEPTQGLYHGFAPVAVVFAAMFARVVLGQLILAELLELVRHRLLQAGGQGAAEALRTHHAGI